jgi:hypothetical protein
VNDACCLHCWTGSSRTPGVRAPKAVGEFTTSVMEPPTSVQVNNLPVGADLAQDERPSRADRVRAKVKRGNRRPVELLNRQILRLNQRARRRRAACIAELTPTPMLALIVTCRREGADGTTENSCKLMVSTILRVNRRFCRARRTDSKDAFK